MRKLRLVCNRPAEDNHYGWENEALPIGNGKQGAVVFGGVEREHIQFNEKSLWTGGPSPKRPDYNGGNRLEKYPFLKAVQKSLAEGDSAAVETLVHELEGEQEGYGAYQSFGDIDIDFGSDSCEEYQRELDLENALVNIRYRSGGREFDRCYFASFPDKVIAGRYRVSTGGMDCVIRLRSAQGAEAECFAGLENTLCIRGQLADNALRYEALLCVYTNEGSIACEKTNLIIKDAQEICFLLTCGTDYAASYPDYRGEDPHEALAERLRGALRLGWDALCARHVEDYRALYGRLCLELGQAQDTSVPESTEALLEQYCRGEDTAAARYLELLLFQYGRYLSIASSRAEAGALPSNLQGVWNDSNNPAWGSDYHLNINLQMNYWPTTAGNLLECCLPLLDYVESLREPGRITAKAYLGIESTPEKPQNGFSAHTQNTIFGWTCPGWSFYWGWSPAAVPWILQNLWEYYDFTRDTAILRERIYPLMKEEVTLYEQLLIWDARSGRRVSSPSYSPEHGPVSVGNTYEQSLIYQLYADTIEAAAVLGVDADLAVQWRTTLAALKPIHIGTDGQIKEWYEESSLGSMPKSERRHRHISHLLGLYPGDMISSDTREWLEAAKVSLLDRGDENTGWSMGHKINAWARTGDGDYAHRLMRKMISSCILNNLWDSHPPFQIDGNFAYTAGVLELLLQSHLGRITLLPALPSAWPEGSLYGALARGGFTLSFRWEGGRVRYACVLAGRDGECRLELQHAENYSLHDAASGEALPLRREGDVLCFFLAQGRTAELWERRAAEKTF